MRLLLASLLVSAFTFVSAQNCLFYKDGGKLFFTSTTYANSPMMLDPVKWKKLKDDKKELAVEEFNKSVLNGTEKGTTTKSTFTIVKTSTDGIERAALTAFFGTYKYTGLAACKNDTTFFTRNAEPIYLIVDKDTQGVTFQGVQVIPNKLKVGDKLPSYEDISVFVPKSRTYNVQDKVFSHSATTTTSQMGWGYDASVGKFGYGTVNTTTTTAVYNLIDVQVRETLKHGMYFLHYAVSLVTGEEEVTINGTKYKAFIIDSESWTKSTIDATYEAERESVIKAQAAAHEKYMAKAGKIARKMGINNEFGYMVMPKTEWFVPGLGMVKTISYDPSGAIAAIMTVDGFE